MVAGHRLKGVLEMRHPLEFLPLEVRKPMFFTFLFLTLVLFAVFRVLDLPLRTDAAPNGIVSFELAGDARTARSITDSWKQMSLLLSATGNPNPDIVNVPYAFAAFGLGLDYLFMPVYALALGFASLLAAQKHTGVLRSMAVAAGYGAYAAALFDALENYALFQMLLGSFDTDYPAIAAFCAIAKFGLLVFGILVSLAAWLLPRRKA
ncbi:MAG TPA: hypothetical protein VK888_10060 [Anaerolineales bacterium]|nr:hypothetical protein [Anaerolineales bacterium]